MQQAIGTELLNDCLLLYHKKEPTHVVPSSHSLSQPPAPVALVVPPLPSPVRIALPYCPRCRPSHHVPTLSHTDPVCSPGCLQSLQPAPPTEGGFSPAVCEKPQVQSARGLWSLRRHKRSGGTYPLVGEASHRPSVCLPTRLSPTPRLPHLCPSPFVFARLVLRPSNGNRLCVLPGKKREKKTGEKKP